MSQLENLDVTKSSDAQEAESRKYFAWGVLRLSSGRYAVFSIERKLVGICDDPRELGMEYTPPDKLDEGWYFFNDSSKPSLDDIVERLMKVKRQAE